MNYGSSSGTLNSSNVKGPKDMGNNGPNKLMGKMSFGDQGKKLFGSTVKASSSSGISGPMSGSGYPGGARQTRLTEPGNLKPGTRAQAKNTTRINPDEGTVHATPQNRGSTAKVLRGGK